MMFKEFRKEIEWAGQKLVLETGKIARQADVATWFRALFANHGAQHLALAKSCHHGPIGLTGNPCRFPIPASGRPIRSLYGIP